MLERIRKYKAVAIVMSILMFTTSIGFSIDMHFCQGNFKNLSLIGDAQNCHDVVKKMTNPHCAKKQAACHKVETSPTESIDNKGCCNNKTISLQLEEDFVAANQLVVNDNQSIFLLAFVSSYLVVENRDADTTPYKNYKPPLLERDLPILFQSFLI